MPKRFLAPFLFLAVLFVSSPVFAFGTSDPVSAQAQNFLPALDESRYFTTYSSQTMQQWQWRTGAYFNYAKNPLEIGAAGRTLGKVIEHLIWADIYGSIGFFDWMQMGIDVPVALYETFFNPSIASPKQETVVALGDARLEFKFRLLDIDQYNVGIALLPYGSFPTGDGNKFTGNNSFMGGIKLVTDFDIIDRVQISLNVGYLNRKNYSVPARAIRIDDSLTYGLGVNVKINDWMQAMAEGYGSTVLKDAFNPDIVRELPLETDVGMRFFPIETLAVTVGGGMGLTTGYGTPDYRAIVGIAYTRPRRVELPPPPPPPPETLAYIEKKAIIITRKIHFEFDKSIIRPVSFPILQAVADILTQNPSVQKVRIEGHTDWIGSDAYNIKLSNSRAGAVRKWLVDHGIATSRLESVGYGEGQPIADNKTALGRAKNRRVQFTILQQETRVPVGSPEAVSPPAEPTPAAPEAEPGLESEAPSKPATPAIHAPTTPTTPSAPVLPSPTPPATPSPVFIP